jgi:alanine racemase
VARALLALEPWGFGVATAEEGAELRQAGIRRPIVIFTPLLPADLAAARDAGLTPALGDAQTIAAWADAGGGPWHLAIDTGMHRAGARWSDVGSLVDVVTRCPPEGVFTHFHSADDATVSLVEQTERFEWALAALPIRPPVRHAENSAAMARVGASAWTVVRPGIFLFGAAAGGEAPEPVAALRARVIDLHAVAPGEGVSYGMRYRAAGPRRVATVAAGYADGYRRAFSNVGRAIVNGHRVPVAGTVTMDMTMLDVTGVPCAIGDVVTLLGPVPRAASDGGPPHGIDLATAAREADVAVYEMLTGLHARLPRVYLGAHDE